MAQSTSNPRPPNRIIQLRRAYEKALNAPYQSDEFGHHVGPIPNPALAWTGFDHSPQYPKFRSIRGEIVRKVARRLAREKGLIRDESDQYSPPPDLPPGQLSVRSRIRDQIRGNRNVNPFTNDAVQPAGNGPIRLAHGSLEFCPVLVSIDAETRVGAGAIPLSVDDKTTENVMCGTYYDHEASFRAHLRSLHPGAVQDPAETASSAARTASKKAIRRYVLTGEWRRARFHTDPIETARIYGIRAKIDDYCDELEEIASYYPDFAEKYGTVFHRDENNILKEPENPNVSLGESQDATEPVLDIEDLYDYTNLQ